MKRVKSLLAASVCFLAVRLCSGQIPPIINNTPGTAATMALGQKVTVKLDHATLPSLWYLAAAVPGRSYCAEVGGVESPSIAEQHPFMNLAVYGTDTTTIVEGDSITVDEPRTVNFPRTCWIQSAAGGSSAFLNLQPASGGISFVTLRLVETTLYSPWFFVAGDYNAFSLIRNTTSQTQTATVVWRGLNGSVAGTTKFPIPPNGTAIVNARDFVDPLFSNGSVEIAHVGSPQALVGSTTTLSGTTGLGFDAKFEQRKPW